MAITVGHDVAGPALAQSAYDAAAARAMRENTQWSAEQQARQQAQQLEAQLAQQRMQQDAVNQSFNRQATAEQLRQSQARLEQQPELYKMQLQGQMDRAELANRQRQEAALQQQAHQWEMGIMQGVRDGKLRYTDQQQQKLDELEIAAGRVQGDSRLSPEQRMSALVGIDRQRRSIQMQPIPVRPDQQPKSLEEYFKQEGNRYEDDDFVYFRQPDGKVEARPKPKPKEQPPKPSSERERWKLDPKERDRAYAAARDRLEAQRMVDAKRRAAEENAKNANSDSFVKREADEFYTSPSHAEVVGEMNQYADHMDAMNRPAVDPMEALRGIVGALGSILGGGGQSGAAPAPQPAPQPAPAMTATGAATIGVDSTQQGMPSQPQPIAPQPPTSQPPQRPQLAGDQPGRWQAGTQQDNWNEYDRERFMGDAWSGLRATGKKPGDEVDYGGRRWKILGERLGSAPRSDGSQSTYDSRVVLQDINSGTLLYEDARAFADHFGEPPEGRQAMPPGETVTRHDLAPKAGQPAAPTVQSPAGKPMKSPYSVSLGKPVSEQDIADTMKANGLTREQAMQAIGVVDLDEERHSKALGAKVAWRDILRTARETGRSPEEVMAELGISASG